MTLDAIRAADAEWQPRCQWVYPVSPDDDETWPPSCAFEQSHRHRIESALRWGHVWTYDPALDTSPEAHRRLLLAMVDELTQASNQYRAQRDEVRKHNDHQRRALQRARVLLAAIEPRP